ncbi:hypothetical protein BCR34DRAFT_585248 [Clohesyomyces aquaticus]|uniref:Uncharacterized protein n=1 Tax=Clohesyomyces aquaticus TaxID=1231657 RepID=A0A1Y1ZZB5_9PLEO|nr:hypothetical protein BCR34DRAFT_585248 [Clohesyomyces aquaticus]
MTMPAVKVEQFQDLPGEPLCRTALTTSRHCCTKNVTGAKLDPEMKEKVTTCALIATQNALLSSAVVDQVFLRKRVQQDRACPDRAGDEGVHVADVLKACELALDHPARLCRRFNEMRFDITEYERLTMHFAKLWAWHVFASCRRPHALVRSSSLRAGNRCNRTASLHLILFWHESRPTSSPLLHGMALLRLIAVYCLSLNTMIVVMIAPVVEMCSSAGDRTAHAREAPNARHRFHEVREMLASCCPCGAAIGPFARSLQPRTTMSRRARSGEGPQTVVGCS